MRSLPRSPTNTSAAPFLRPCANFCAQHSNEVHGHASQKGKSIQRIVYSKKEASGSDASFVVRPSGFEPLAYRVGVCHSIQLSYGRIFSRSYYSKVRPKSKADFLFPFAAPDTRCIQVQMRSPRRRKRPLAFDSKAALSFRKCRDCNPGIYLIQSRSELEHAPSQYA